MLLIIILFNSAGGIINFIFYGSEGRDTTVSQHTKIRKKIEKKNDFFIENA